MNKIVRKLLIVLIIIVQYGSFGAFIAIGLNLLDKLTSRTGWTTEARDNVPIWIVFGVVFVVCIIVRRVLVKGTKKETKDS